MMNQEKRAKKVSIIIPCREIGPDAIKCIKEILNQEFQDFEIIILPDHTVKRSKDERLRIITTGKVKPALKRNIGMKNAEGEFFAFIDDDAYPTKDWLKKAMKHFEEDKDKKIGIVGGPNLTPPDANFAEKVSGYVSSNYWVAGPASIRHKIAKSGFTEELPSCNYIARKEASSDYDECFLTAEDSRFCFICVKKGYKVLYANDVIVYHHRRDSLIKHLKQYYIFGRDIAWLTRKEFSFDKLFFSIMSLFVIWFVVSLISVLSSLSITGSVVGENVNLGFNFINYLFFLVIVVYLLIMIITSIHENIKTSYYVFVVSIGTHFAYGIGWLKGILTSPEDSAKVSWISR